MAAHNSHTWGGNANEEVAVAVSIFDDEQARTENLIDAPAHLNGETNVLVRPILQRIELDEHS